MEIFDLFDFFYGLGSHSLSRFWVPIGIWTFLAAGPLLFIRKNAGLYPQVNYQILTALLLALPLGALLAFAAPFSIPAPQALYLLDAPEAPIPQQPPSPGVDVPVYGLNWSFYHIIGALTLVLIAISAVKVFYLIKESIRLHRMASSIQGLALSEVSETLERIRRSWGIGENVVVVFSKDNHVPMTFGWRKAFIVLPQDLRNREEALHMTLVHELAHIRNADFVRQWIEKVIAALFFFHPLVQLLANQIDQSREMNCDSEVLSQRDISPGRYASLLLDFASPVSNTPLFSISMSTDESNLKQRILAMKDYPLFSSGALRSRKAIMLLSVLLLAVATLIVACEVKFETDNSVTIIESPAGIEKTAPDITVTPGGPASGEEVFMIVEDMPELIGGLRSIQENIKYPTIARKAGIEGRVFVQFVVDETGKVVDPVVVRGIGAGCDEEAIRAVSQAQFRPGRQRGEVVRVKMSLPITFKLEETPGEIAAELGLLGKRIEEQRMMLEKTMQQFDELSSADADKASPEQLKLKEREIDRLKDALVNLENAYANLQKRAAELEYARR